MKTLVLSNQKGGVGKSAVAVQYGYYASLILGKRVLIIDFDHQRNTSKAFRMGEIATVSKVTSSQILLSKVDKSRLESAEFVLIPGDDDLLRNAEPVDLKSKEKLSIINEMTTNLYGFIESVSDQFDLCIIDTNPNPDIRQLAAMIVADFVLSPIQLNQEAIDGIGDLLNHENVGIRRIQATINPKLKMLGILPNMVEATPFQKENLRDLSAAYAGLMIKQGKSVAAIKRTTAIAEAQAAGQPVWKMPKTSAREAWAHLKPTFDNISSLMGIA